MVMEMSSEGRIYKYMYTKSINTRWTIRTRKTRSEYLETGHVAGRRVEVQKAAMESECKFGRVE